MRRAAPAKTEPSTKQRPRKSGDLRGRSDALSIRIFRRLFGEFFGEIFGCGRRALPLRERPVAVALTWPTCSPYRARTSLTNSCPSSLLTNRKELPSGRVRAPVPTSERAQAFHLSCHRRSWQRRKARLPAESCSWFSFLSVEICKGRNGKLLSQRGAETLKRRSGCGNSSRHQKPNQRL